MSHQAHEHRALQSERIIGAVVFIISASIAFGACLTYAVVWCRGEVVPTESRVLQAPERPSTSRNPR